MGQQPWRPNSQRYGRRIGLAEGSRVEMEMKNDRIVLSLARPKYRLEICCAE